MCSEMYWIQSGLFSVLVALLTHSFLFNTFSLHFPKYVKTDPKYLNAVMPLISALASIFIFCVSLTTFRYSVLRTFKPHGWYYSVNFFVIYSASSLSYPITGSSAKKMMYWWCIVIAPVGNPIFLHFFFKV